MKRRKISVIIPTRRKDIEIARGALTSVVWADEIIVADSSVTKHDRNKVEKVAKEFNAKFIHRNYRYSANFKNWAIPQVKHKWVLLVDSDEIVTEKLQKAILNLLSTGEIEQYDGFGIARKHFFFGNFLRFGGRYPLYNVRLFRRKCRYEDRDVHAHIVLKKEKMGIIKPKQGDMLHFSDRNFTQFFERFDRYTTYQANYMKKTADKGLIVNPKEFVTNFIYFKSVIKDVWFFVPTTAMLRFLWMYVIRLGFLDGRYGLTIAMLYGFQDYVSKTKYYHLEQKQKTVRVRLQNVFVRNFISIAPKNTETVYIKKYQDRLLRA